MTFERRLGLTGQLAVKAGLIAAPHPVHAVKAANITIARGEVLGLVGESGSGESTLGRVICGIYTPTGGTFQVNGRSVRRNGRKIRTNVQMIFQDPFASLDPRRTIFQSVADGPLLMGFALGPMPVTMSTNG